MRELSGGLTQENWSAGDRDELEDEHDGAEPTEDEEPSLGWTVDGEGRYATTDLEDEHDGAEPDVDDEPSLGSFDRMANQEKAWRQSLDAGFYPDAEADDADKEDDGTAEDAEPSGIADEDGLRSRSRLWDWRWSDARCQLQNPAPPGMEEWRRRVLQRHQLTEFNNRPARDARSVHTACTARGVAEHSRLRRRRNTRRHTRMRCHSHMHRRSDIRIRIRTQLPLRLTPGR